MRYCSYVNRLRTVPIELSVQTINTTKKRMNVLVLFISIAVTAQTTAHARKIPLDQAPASGQQCLSCQGEDCNGEAPVTAHCSVFKSLVSFVRHVDYSNIGYLSCIMQEYTLYCL